MEAIGLAAKRMAVEEGISEQRAEQRLAAELLDHLDSSWNAKHQEEGRETDTVALDYLAESLSDVGGFYKPSPDSDIPVAPEDAPTYTAGEVKGWLQGYSANHENAYENRTLDAEGLRNPFSEMTQFYNSNLQEDAGFTDELSRQAGEVMAVGSTVVEMGQALYTLADEPIASGEAIINETARMVFDAGDYFGEVIENKQEAEMNAALDAYQGDHYSAGYSGTKGDLELGLEVLGVVPLPGAKVGVVTKLDNLVPDSGQALLPDYSNGMTKADAAQNPPIQGITVQAPDAIEPITDPARLLEYKPGVEKGRELQTYYPPNRGVIGEVTLETLVPGTRIDRYGYESGTFVAPANTPYPMRALPPGSDKKPFATYEVKRPIETNSGTTAPAFNQIGLGKQHELPKSIEELIESNHLERIDE